jgi:hypothetical protein
MVEPETDVIGSFGNPAAGTFWELNSSLDPRCSKFCSGAVENTSVGRRKHYLFARTILEAASQLPRLGIPQVPHIASWVRILRKKYVLRRAALEAQRFINESVSRVTNPSELLSGHQVEMDVLKKDWVSAEGGISSVDDLESVFADQALADFVIYPELPAKALVTLAGDSESGKTTPNLSHARCARFWRGGSAR